VVVMGNIFMAKKREWKKELRLRVRPEKKSRIEDEIN